MNTQADAEVWVLIPVTHADKVRHPSLLPGEEALCFVRDVS